MGQASKIVRDVVASCEVCIATKAYTCATAGSMYYEEPLDSGQLVSLDLYEPLPKSINGYQYVLVLLDVFSKHTSFYPMPNQRDESIIQRLETDYFPQRGFVPATILTDCGGQFLTAAWRNFALRAGFAARRTTPYNPQSNPVERVMRELGRALRVYSHQDHTAWDTILPRLEAVINFTTHASTGCPPCWLEKDQGWINRKYLRPDDYPRTEFTKQMKRARSEYHPHASSICRRS